MPLAPSPGTARAAKESIDIDVQRHWLSLVVTGAASLPQRTSLKRGSGALVTASVWSSLATEKLKALSLSWMFSAGRVEHGQRGSR